MKEPTPSSPSPELQQANERLHKLRQETQLYKAELGLKGPKRPSLDNPPWEESESIKSAQSSAAIVTKLPSHLGWGSAPASKAIRKAIRCRDREALKDKCLTADHLPFRPIVDECDQGYQPSDSQSSETAGRQLGLLLYKEAIKHYPDIGIAALKQEQAAIYRVWLICRYLDEQGRGWLPVQEVREQLTGKESKLRLFGWRRLRQILGQGHGRFWTWDKGNARLWLFGAARVAANLKVTRLRGKTVFLPVTAVTKSIGEFKAHLYAAWHSGRKSNNPISREVQESITSVPERTQRHYCKVARIKCQANIAIGGKYSKEKEENQAWQRGQAIFKFIDHQGRLGQKGTSYISWHLPNSYIGPHKQTASGRMRKINRKLQVLVQKGARGNNRKKIDKMYYANGKEAGRALNRSQGLEVYWLLLSMSRLSSLWTVFSLA